MRTLRIVSWVITLVGAAAVAGSLLSVLDPTIGLIGLMLLVAGLVKILVVSLWHGLPGFGMALSAQDPARDAAIEEGRR